MFGGGIRLKGTLGSAISLGRKSVLGGWGGNCVLAEKEMEGGGVCAKGPGLCWDVKLMQEGGWRLKRREPKLIRLLEFGS